MGVGIGGDARLLGRLGLRTRGCVELQLVAARAGFALSGAGLERLAAEVLAATCRRTRHCAATGRRRSCRTLR